MPVPVLVDQSGLDELIAQIKAKFGSSCELTIDKTTYTDKYVVTLTLKNFNGSTLGTTQTVEIPVADTITKDNIDEWYQDIEDGENE